MWLDIILLILFLFTLLYFVIKRNFKKFSSAGVPQADPSFPLGSPHVFLLLTGKVGFTTMYDCYKGTQLENESYFGTFFFGFPTLCINDQELAKKIMVKDFDHFVDRREFSVGHERNKLGKIPDLMLTSLKGDEWKQVRSLMSPVFTSGKLKLMTKHLVKVGMQIEDYLSSIASNNENLEAKEMFGKFTLDAISTSGFGIESNSFTDPKNIFRESALKLVKAPGYSSKFDTVKLMIGFMLPKKLANLLRIEFFPSDAMEFFAKIIMKTIKHREATGERRNDIIDLILDQMKQEKDDEKTNNMFEDAFEKNAAIDTSDITKKDLDKELTLIANAIIFFFAGFDTTSTGLSIIVWYLVKYQEVQEMVREEIKEVMGDSDVVTFDHLQEMKYMDKVIQESFRHNNLVHMLERKCTKDYKLPGSDYVIKKDEIVRIWTDKFAASEDNFYNPKEFDPENFAPENSPDKFATMIFGQGPRNCIGMRYALLTLKVALVHSLMKFQLEPCDKTVDELILDPVSLSGAMLGGVWFKPKLIH